MLLPVGAPKRYNKSMYVGIDIGGTKILAASSPTGRSMTKSQKIATPENPKVAIDAIVDLVHNVSGGKPVASIGVSSPGPLDLARGIITTPPNLPWRNIEIKRILEKRLHASVTVQHDCACAGLAEALLGSGIGYHKVLYVTISTGIGTGLIIGGQIYHGKQNIEGGHITVIKDGPECSCGALGHFEAIASGHAIKREFGKNAYEIKDAATWDKIAQNMAVGLSSLTAALGPDIIVLGGGVSVHHAHFKRPLDKYMHQYFRYGIPPVKIAKYIETAPVMGALLLASQAEQLML